MGYRKTWFDILYEDDTIRNKYNKAGVYSISVDGELLYIGKSKNMLMRLAQHIKGINKGKEKKYQELKKLKKEGKTITFDVLYEGDDFTRVEAELIKKHNPPLNSVMPSGNQKERESKKVEVDGFDFSKGE